MRRHRPYDGVRDQLVCDSLVASFSDQDLEQVVVRVNAFLQALADAHVHVGIGSPPRCPTCRRDWPCAPAVHAAGAHAR